MKLTWKKNPYFWEIDFTNDTRSYTGKPLKYIFFCNIGVLRLNTCRCHRNIICNETEFTDTSERPISKNCILSKLGHMA